MRKQSVPATEQGIYTKEFQEITVLTTFQDGASSVI